MTIISVSEARKRFSELLDRVTQGEHITISRRGRPVAEVIPLHTQSQMTTDEAVDRLVEFGKGKSLGGLTVRELIDDGKRF